MTIDTPVSGYKPSTVLVVFDFDETMVDCNSDIFINRMAPGGTIPQEIIEKYASEQDWTSYMQHVFEYLASCGVTQSDYHKCLAAMPLVGAMKDLFMHLRDGLSSTRFEVIIISDANTFFIDNVLQAYGIKDVVRKVHTNAAQFDGRGCLQIERYHVQDWCKLSTRNMCKGHILKDYIARRETTGSDGVKFDRVMYVGDGWNDLCPSLKLSSQDVVFPRYGYRLHKLIVNKQEGADQIKASISPFRCGLDIWNVIKNTVQ